MALTQHNVTCQLYYQGTSTPIPGEFVVWASTDRGIVKDSTGHKVYTGQTREDNAPGGVTIPLYDTAQAGIVPPNFQWAIEFDPEDKRVQPIGPFYFSLTADKTFEEIVEAAIGPYDPTVLEQLATGLATIDADGTSPFRVQQDARLANTYALRTSRAKHAPAFRLYFPEAEGAVGDGTTDDTAAIHAARTAAGSTGVLHFAATYLTTGLTANVAGQRWTFAPGAQLKLKAAATNPVVNVTASNFTIEHLGIDGNRANVSSSNTIGLQALSVSRLRVIGGTITNCLGYGVVMSAVSDVLLDRVTVSGCAATASNQAQVWINGATGACDGVTLDRCFLDGTATQTGGLKVHSNNSGVTHTDIKTLGCTVKVGDAGSTDTLGIEYWTGSGGTIRSGVIANNRVVGANNTNAHTFGISIGGGSTGATTGNFGIAVVGNVVKDCRILGIELLGSNLTCVGNTLEASGNISVSAGGFTGGLQGVTVANNTLRATPTVVAYAILLSGTASNPLAGAVVANNVIESPDALNSAAIWLTGTVQDSRVTGNIIRNALCPGVSSAGSAQSTNLLRVTIDDNTVTTSASAASTVDGIAIQTAAATDLVISRNRSYAAKRHGLNFLQALTGVRVVDNIAQGAGTYGFYFQGANAGWTVIGNDAHGNGNTGFNWGAGTGYVARNNRAYSNTTAQHSYGTATFVTADTNGNFAA